MSKIVKRSKVHKPEEVDLKGEVEEIEEYTRNFVPTPPRYDAFVIIFRECSMLTLPQERFR